MVPGSGLDVIIALSVYDGAHIEQEKPPPVLLQEFLPIIAKKLRVMVHELPEQQLHVQLAIPDELIPFCQRDLRHIAI